MHVFDAIHQLLGSHHGPLSSLGAPGDMVFFQQINDFLRDEIDEFAVNLLGRTAAWLGSIVLSLMTLWIMVQGYRIATGQSRDSMMLLVSNSLRSVLIISIATAAAAGSSSVYRGVTDGLSTQVAKVVTGHDEDPYKRIDRSLWYMQLAMSSIDAVQDAGDPVTNGTKDRALWFSSLGTAGPAITGGTMLLLNKIAMALFVGLGPLFILCLLFDQTKPLFGRWLYYGLGTMFSLAVLSVMVSLALDMVLAVAAAFWTSTLLPIEQEGMLSLSMQQGGMGLILTMLIISAPPMAAMFFQGTLGVFAPGSAFDRGTAQRGPYAQQLPQGAWIASAGGVEHGVASVPAQSAQSVPARYSSIGSALLSVGAAAGLSTQDTIKRNATDRATRG
jgi:type IV secretion system protein VirB6